MGKALTTDLYEIKMSYVYFNKGMKDEEAVFDIYYRTNPDKGGYVIACGLESIIDYVKNFHFDNEEIEFLKSTNDYSDEFLDYLKNIRFNGDIYSVEEGTVIFPQEPVIRIKAKIIEAQLLETYILMLFNHQSLIATKANRIVRAAQGRPVTEFGARRAHNEDAAMLGTRAAYIGGCLGTSIVEAERLYNVKSFGTMAHSFVQSFDTEYEAFLSFANMYPYGTSLLIDTYDVLNSGLKNAIRIFKEVLEPKGIKQGSVRIDSGDLSYLSNEVRKGLDKAGLNYVKIMLTNSLDEYSISEIITNGASVDLFGVGERLITSSSSPILDGVYKMSAISKGGILHPVIKISASHQKTTNPGIKKVYRIYSNESNKAEADLICLDDEIIDFTKPLTLFDPNYTYKKKTFDDYHVKELLVPIFINGNLVYKNNKSVIDIRSYALEQVETLWPEVKRYTFPHEYYVDLSDKLYDLKKEMIRKETDGNI